MTSRFHLQFWIRCLLVFSLWVHVDGVHAQGWLNLYGDGNDQRIFDFEELPDGGFLLIGSQNISPASRITWIGRTDFDRELVWDTVLPYYPGDDTRVTGLLQESINGIYSVLVKDRVAQEMVLLSVDPDIGVIHTADLDDSADSNDNGFFGAVEGIGGNGLFIFNNLVNRCLLLRVDSLGQELWRDTLQNTGQAIIGLFALSAGNGGDYQLLWNTVGGTFITTWEENGTQLQTQAFPQDIGNSSAVLLTSEKHIVTATFKGMPDSTVIEVSRVDSQLNLVWARHLSALPFPLPLFPTFLTEHSPDRFGLTGAIWWGPPNYNMLIVDFDGEGNVNWQKIYDFHQSADRGIRIKADADGGYIISGSTFTPWKATQGLLLKVDSLGNYFTHFIRGQIAVDSNMNCLVDSGEAGVRKWIVKAQNTAQIHFAISNMEGFYEMITDTGQYEVTTYPFGYWEACEDTVQVASTQFYDTSTVDFAVQAATDCPYMDVDVNASFFRLCWENVLRIDYCNLGTVPADSVTVSLLLDPLLTVDSTSLPIAAQSGDTLFFELGTVTPFECGQIRVFAKTPCDTTYLGTVICAEAHISPDSFCGDPQWQGPLLSLNSECDGDSLTFEILNEGAPMAKQHQYIVIEDNIILMSGQVQLGGNESAIIKVAHLPEATYHLLAAQDSMLPPFLGNPVAILSVPSCQDSLGELPLLSFPSDNGQPFLSTFCDPIIGSWDPNDKQAWPRGWKAAHIIDCNTTLQYRIRFQNTGTDTAFRVVLVDTLSPFLDPATLRVQSSSHDYKVQLSGGGVLQFLFDDILLPDSATNEAASQGYVSFQIEQQPNLSLGTVIENFADIYFDFNPPVRTNTTFHTIGEPFVQVITQSILWEQPSVEIQCFPNPARYHLQVQVQSEVLHNGSYELFNIQGQRLRIGHFENNQLDLDVRALPAGMYSLRLWGVDQPLGVVQLVVVR